jgi:hypothetical protein
MSAGEKEGLFIFLNDGSRYGFNLVNERIGFNDLGMVAKHHVPAGKAFYEMVKKVISILLPTFFRIQNRCNIFDNPGTGYVNSLSTLITTCFQVVFLWRFVSI